MENPKSQITSSSYFSNSVISEPPDIKQWFSSYTYQSPELDTNEKDLCFSHGINDEERGLFVEDSETEEEEIGEDSSKRDHFMNCRSIEEASEHEGPSLPGVEVPTYQDSLSMPSEPPDITNWFSSYVYESPELDSTFDASFSSDCTYVKKKEVDEGREDHFKSLPVIEVRNGIRSCRETDSRFTGVGDSRTPSTFKENGSGRSCLSPENGLCSTRTHNESNLGAEIDNCSKIQEIFYDNSRTETEDNTPAAKMEQHMSNNEHVRSQAKTPSSDAEERAIEKQRDPDESNFGWISLNHKPREENQVTVMKSKVRPRANKENSPVKSVCPSDGRKEEMSRRVILKETTNFNLSRVPEVSGKWRCPQKYKPDTGPPLKQLRLEKWFRR